VSVIEASLLGLVQGLTEFLPVSSSGHLAVLEQLWKLEPTARLPLAAMLHGATALAVVFYFAPLIRRLAGGLWSKDAVRRESSRRMALYLAIATVPAGLVGVFLGDVIERAFASPLLIGLMLLVTGGVLLGTHRTEPRGKTGLLRAVLVGVAQAIAVLPGISRSGATITSGLYLGMRREEAFEFSFLLSLPAVLGAFLLEARKIDTSVVGRVPLAAGVVAAFVSGLAALYILRRAVTGRKLWLFAFYCWAAGLATVVWVR
jgi:undecaprenyl-diphosphatase